jgi:Ribonuclease G/E
VRQIRLRDLGGIIVIDFIDMDERKQPPEGDAGARRRAPRRPRSVKVLQFNDFGLVAITRKRVKQSLERTLGAPCPYCEATGFVKSITTVCNEIYVELRKVRKHIDTKGRDAARESGSGQGAQGQERPLADRNWKRGARSSHPQFRMYRSSAKSPSSNRAEDQYSGSGN